MAAPLSYSFTLLDHPAFAQVLDGNVLSWPNEDGTGYRLLTYAIDDDLLPNEDEATRQAAVQAILQSLQSWSDASAGIITFEEAIFAPVENHDSTPKVQFEGPSIEEWIAMGQPGDMPFGWGANIDFFSESPGFTMYSNNIEYRMRNGILGFTAIHRNGNRIESVDIYLNNNFDWTTIIPDDPGDESDPVGPQFPVYSPGGRPIGTIGSSGPSTAADAPSDPGMVDSLNFKVGSKKKSRGIARFSCSGGFCIAEGHAHGAAGSGEGAATSSEDPEYDVETFIVHELGHALGLDHPDEAGSLGGAVMDPYTSAELPQSAGDNDEFVMFSYYTGIKRAPSADEEGGLAHLYPNPVPGDLNVDGQVTTEDAIIAIQLWLDGGATPRQVRAIDIVTQNGQIDLDEVTWLMQESLN